MSDDLKEHLDGLKKIFKENGILEVLKKLRNALENQGKFNINYIKMFQVILLFIRELRENLWQLHLSLMNDFAKYFFEHNQLNYARMTPLYLANMMDIKENDVQTWEYLKDNFSASKSEIPFTSIGSDHVMKQKHKSLNVSGGAIDLTQKPSTLNPFCLTAPILNELSHECCK